MQFVEVWGPDGRSRRFAPGTRASFAVERFNKKLVDAVKPVVCVEAFKEGEDAVEFGPDAELVSMCTWDLRVVQEGVMCSSVPDKSVIYLASLTRSVRVCNISLF